MMKTAVLGASRGLGYCLVEECSKVQSVLAVARKNAPWTHADHVQFLSVDLANKEGEGLLQSLKQFSPERIIYVAGGGPFGPFTQKKWAAHEWAFQLGFLTPARLLHRWSELSTLRQFVYVGSSIAEERGDAYAASYAASKHAFLGLYRSMIQENQGDLDFRVYSPGYMDTDMLPTGSWPRLQPQKLWDPKQVARDLLEWSSDPTQAKSHKKLTLFSTI